MNGSVKGGALAFKDISDGAVKSITQRQVLRYWERLRGMNALPVWSQIDPGALSVSREHLCVMEINRESGAVRFRIREHGQKLAEYYGSACAGKFLDEFMTPPALAALSAVYNQAISTKRPVYTIAPIVDIRGRSVTCERLLLPFTVTGKAVDVVLVSLEAISDDGAFEQFKVLEPMQRNAVPAFQGVINAPPQS
jgi:hypothetical protein